MISEIKGKFCYETHMHTCEASACASAHGAEQAKFYKKMGYTGIVVTDHFFNGNSCIPRGLPWEKRVELFCRGFELAAEEGAKAGLDVFFGWEFNYSGSEMTTFGLDREWLLRHPEIDKMGMNDYADLVHADGGFLTHVHPMREAWYIPNIQLFPNKTDAVEIFNASRPDDENAHNADYAKSYGLPVSAGSDNHTAFDCGRLGGVCVPKRCANIMELADFIKNGKAELVRIERNI